MVIRLDAMTKGSCRYGEDAPESALRPSNGGQTDEEDPAEETDRRVTFLKGQSCSRNQMKKELQGRINAQICQISQWSCLALYRTFAMQTRIFMVEWQGWKSDCYSKEWKVMKWQHLLRNFTVRGRGHVSRTFFHVTFKCLSVSMDKSLAGLYFAGHKCNRGGAGQGSWECL